MSTCQPFHLRRPINICQFLRNLPQWSILYKLRVVPENKYTVRISQMGRGHQPVRGGATQKRIQRPGRGPRNMKSTWLPLVVIFFYNLLYRAGGGGVAFWVTNPCRITRNVEQTKMYVCTLKNIYSSRCSHIAVQVGTEYALEML